MNPALYSKSIRIVRIFNFPELAITMNNLAKTIIIPHGCVENFVDFSDLPDGSHWFGQGVVMAALAHHVPGYSVDYPAPRRHSIQYCLGGCYRFEYGTEHGELRPGELLVLPRGHRQKFHAAEPSRNIFWLLDPAEWGGELRFAHKRSSHGELLRLLMETALHERYSPSPESGLRRNLANLAVSLLRRETAVSNHRESPLEKLAARLRLRPDRQWTVEEMAGLCGLSAPYLYAVCRKHAGQSPYGLLTRIRMELAETLLARTDYPVKVIASQCGYALPFSFTRAFVKHAGMPPREYRRLSAAGTLPAKSGSGGETAG